MLVKAKQNGDPPPYELQSWINNMEKGLADRLIFLCLIERRRVERGLSVDDHIAKFQSVVASRKTNSATHAQVQANRVRRICKSLKIASLDEITEDDVLCAVGKMKLAVSSRRAYFIAIKDFTKWASKNGRASKNPLTELKPPGQYEAPEVERVPLTIKQFRALVAYLDTFELYKGQQSRWSASDRKLIYWTAVATGYRKGELISLRVRNVDFTCRPPAIFLGARDAKNKTAGEVPIATDLAVALKKYTKGRDENERLFPFPTTSRSVLGMLRRDLDGAGIKWDFGKDDPRTVDFHTFRATAITWWLDIYRLSPKKVQVLARLKSPQLVAKYSRNFRLQEFGWLNKGPKLVPSAHARSA